MNLYNDLRQSYYGYYGEFSQIDKKTVVICDDILLSMIINYMDLNV